MVERTKTGMDFLRFLIATSPYKFCDYHCSCCAFQEKCSLSSEIPKIWQERDFDNPASDKWDTTQAIDDIIQVAELANLYGQERMLEVVSRNRTPRRQGAIESVLKGLEEAQGDQLVLKVKNSTLGGLSHLFLWETLDYLRFLEEKGIKPPEVIKDYYALARCAPLMDHYLSFSLRRFFEGEPTGDLFALILAYVGGMAALSAGQWWQKAIRNIIDKRVTVPAFRADTSYHADMLDIHSTVLINELNGYLEKFPEEAKMKDLFSIPREEPDEESVLIITRP